MSLLLDALKRAEQEKLARQGQSPHAAEPAEPAAPRRALELESHEAAHATPSPSPSAPAPAGAAPSATTARDREGAKAVFAAKQPEPPAGVARNKAVIAIVAGAAVLLIAGGAYVWYEINATPGPMIARGPIGTRPVTPAPVAPAPVAAPQAASPSQAPAASPDGRGEAVPPVAVPRPGNAAPTPERTKPQPKAAEQLVMNLLKEAPGAKAAPPLKLTRTIDVPRVSPDVAQGYDALKHGDAAAARKYYEEAVAADPASLDAQLGLATAAARTGDREAATRHYRRALVLDPQNPSAVAGLAALADLSRPEGLEAQLRADITRYPKSAALQFTLGNLYASQSRWSEAQSAYFEAYRLDPSSADLAYNLAVSLDHLGQARLAADFYQRALAASGQQATQFDKGQVSRRIAELKP